MLYSCTHMATEGVKGRLQLRQDWTKNMTSRPSVGWVSPDNHRQTRF